MPDKKTRVQHKTLLEIVTLAQTNGLIRTKFSCGLVSAPLLENPGGTARFIAIFIFNSPVVQL